ncbi:aminotransferase class I/II-fold pyridoxal phosphate-dependent enzyme [Aquimarina brevivitae]|nr:8-amino-7-oxononanoate synthase [Aquimarina brevivitae]
MTVFPKRLQKKLQDRAESNALRQLTKATSLIDFSSNDYLGFSKNKNLFHQAYQLLEKTNNKGNGATGSRLLTGNHELYAKAEEMIAAFHNAESALIFNSGYDANLGLFSSVLQKGDIILYDELIHASIRDGIQMSNAKGYKFRHNDLEDLQKKLKKHQRDTEIYVVTESVFSMDGDSPDLALISKLCQSHKAHLIVDEAHAVGIFGKEGRGLVQELNLEAEVFARINTFGKAIGCHGAAILGSEKLISYLVNYARSFIYTTGLPPHSLATIYSAYLQLRETTDIVQLKRNITYFKEAAKTLGICDIFIESTSAIQCCLISGNAAVKALAESLQQRGFDVKPILSPTVPKGKERLRFCLHSYNTPEEIMEVLQLLATFVKK